MENNIKIADDLLEKICGGELDETTKNNIIAAIDYSKSAGMTVDTFIKQIIKSYPVSMRAEVEDFIRQYWG